MLTLLEDPRDEPFVDGAGNLYGQDYEELRRQCLVRMLKSIKE